ncbi:hypothetical protein [Rhodohalobacter sp. 8-1]
MAKTVQNGRHLVLSTSWRILSLTKAGDAGSKSGMTYMMPNQLN